MPTWLWIVILLVVIIGIGIGLRMRSADGPTDGGSTPATSAPLVLEPVASDVSVARATTSSDAASLEPVASDVSVPRATTSSDAALGPAAVPDVPAVPDGEYGPGSAAPTADGSAPAGFPVKANADSMLFSTDDSPGYRRSTADVYFRDAGTAEAAGFKRWDDHRS